MARNVSSLRYRWRWWQSSILDANAVELLRVWAASGKQHVTIRTEVWEDPWGIFLVDLVPPTKSHELLPHRRDPG
jgi:hypothetical protein